jgi:hypothetical protein
MVHYISSEQYSVNFDFQTVSCTCKFSIYSCYCLHSDDCYLEILRHGVTMGHIGIYIVLIEGLLVLLLCLYQINIKVLRNQFEVVRTAYHIPMCI